MAHFFEMQARKDEVVKNFFARTQDASDSLPLEVAAVTKIQSVHRATQIRIIYHAIVAAASLIQRMVRGCLGRKKAREVSDERKNRLKLHFFHHCACTIQRVFRGRWSRKRVHSFYGRKVYLEKVEKRGVWTKAFLIEEHKEKLAAAKIQEEQKVKEEFDNLAGDLHHLMSTRTIPGVYNPPYSDLLPRAFEKPIEEHLRDACVVKVPASMKRPRHKSAAAARSARFGMSQALGVQVCSLWGSEQCFAAQAEMSQEQRGMPPQELPDRAPYFSRAASSGLGPSSPR
ncbi:Spermatogenesis-associated protein 17 [Durusdinium trenchii]|uniref:Spermatogenesis-associated protein 17 n=1 Tax=Durusdinium trenchii TaxID=1381693 RepID=A0ABP0Q482_9DINO